MRKECALAIIVVVSLIAGLVPGIVQAGSDLTDEQKKQIVYRMYDSYREDFPAVGEISPGEAMEEWRQGHVLFVDVREPVEMRISMLPGAVTRKAFLKNPVQYQGGIIVAYCTIGFRSGKFAMEMEGKGIKILNLRGGLLAWVLEGGRVYDSRGTVTKRIHVYGKKWDYPPEGYESVRLGFFERLF